MIIFISLWTHRLLSTIFIIIIEPNNSYTPPPNTDKSTKSGRQDLQGCGVYTRGVSKVEASSGLQSSSMF